MSRILIFSPAWVVHYLSKKYCCKKMKFSVHNNQTSLSYDPVCREYMIYLRHQSVGEIIEFCPWCGKELPKELRTMFFDLVAQYGIEGASDLYEKKKMNKLPDEFKTDAWWRKRNL